MLSDLPFKKMREGAILPAYGSSGAIGLDLHACDNHIIAPLARCLVSTGVAVAIPPGHYGRVAPRSGLAYRRGLDVLAGVIDPDYTGEIGVVLINLDPKKQVVISAGDRIAQLILEYATRFEPLWVEDCPSTARGAGGFGSTGK
jgi:dUTP pyrophosphatase